MAALATDGRCLANIFEVGGGTGLNHLFVPGRPVPMCLHTVFLIGAAVTAISLTSRRRLALKGFRGGARNEELQPALPVRTKAGNGAFV
jgi:hypothetical protein